MDFYPRSPCGERPPKHEVCRGGINFYPRSPCGERPVRVVRTCWSPYFYPRSPCGERHGQDVLLPAALEFLSTLSLRRATIGGSTNQTHKINFYPRSPCGERLFGNEAMGAGNNNFYPRSPCGERPGPDCQRASFGDDFYPRSPCGERQRANRLAHAPPQISIHALLAESDCCARCHCWGLNEFLSTLSLRRATFDAMQIVVVVIFLSTLSLRRATKHSTNPKNRKGNFYPRSPCGERLLEQSASYNAYMISIHALLAESDQGRQQRY